jgi:Fuc2NAc and GlcNAc transferase
MPAIGFLAVSTGVFLLAFVLTGLVRRYAVARLVDVPNARSSHELPTPRGGGLGIVLAFFAGCLIASARAWLGTDLLLVLLSGVLIAAVGFWDDHRHIPARFRMAAHLAAAGLALFALGGFPDIPLGEAVVRSVWIGSVFAVLWLVWMLNLFNFMDGIDAITGSEVLFVAGAAVVLMLFRDGDIGPAALALSLLTAATFGFLLWNLPPARIFMGDVGSGFVGYMLALLALVDMRANGGGLGLPVWVTLNGVFLVDATCTLLRRFATGQRWYEAHRSHAYQKAALSLGSHAAVVKFGAVINLLWLFPLAVAELVRPGLAIPIAVIAVAPLIGLALRLKAGQA